MKLIIAGSRHLNVTPGQISDLIISHNIPFITEIVSGKAKGIDFCGEAWAKERKIPILSFPANWDKYGKSAGFLRNRQMALYADALLLIWDGKSRGSFNMKQEMLKEKKPVYEEII